MCFICLFLHYNFFLLLTPLCFDDFWWVFCFPANIAWEAGFPAPQLLGSPATQTAQCHQCLGYESIFLWGNTAIWIAWRQVVSFPALELICSMISVGPRAPELKLAPCCPTRQVSSSFRLQEFCKWDFGDADGLHTETRWDKSWICRCTEGRLKSPWQEYPFWTSPLGLSDFLQWN